MEIYPGFAASEVGNPIQSYVMGIYIAAAFQVILAPHILWVICIMRHSCYMIWHMKHSDVNTLLLQVLYRPDGAVAGVATGDMGIAKDGSHKSTFARGIELRARATLLAEGCRGSLSQVCHHCVCTTGCASVLPLCSTCDVKDTPVAMTDMLPHQEWVFTVLEVIYSCPEHLPSRR